MKTIPRVATLLALTATPAFAHVGATSTASFVAGVSHPLTGIDHVAVMVAVGMWAALKGGRAFWVWPMAFVGAMLIGGALGMANVPLPYVESAVAASVMALGILVALAIDLPVWAGALLIGAFAVFHGHAHGSEITETISGVEYMVGFAVATASLHALGITFALLMTRVHLRRVIRGAGLACALAGAVLFAGAFS
jgi:urease accessory protein